MSLNPEGPQRFARMLLVTDDHLAKRPDLDFFPAAMFVPEIGLLGNRLDEIRELGPEAERKLAALPSMSNVGVRDRQGLEMRGCPAPGPSLPYGERLSDKINSALPRARPGFTVDTG
jgi:hypothetical protein